MRGPKLPGRDFKGGFLTAPHLGTPSRLVVFEECDPPVAVEKLSEEERALQGRERAFGCKAVFNPRWRSASNVTSVFWEKDPSIPGYRALVERPNAVRVQGYDPKGQAVDYVAKGWEARLIQQANDLLNGLTFVDRCEMRSLCHLDARNDPLPSDCPVLGAFLSRPSRPPLSEEDTKAAETGGSKGMLGFLPSFGSPSVLLIGSLLLRLPAREVEDFSAGFSGRCPPFGTDQTHWKQAEKPNKFPAGGYFFAKTRPVDLALASGEHPLGVAAPQFGKGIRMVAIGETEDNIEKLTTRAQISEAAPGRTEGGPEHRVFKPTILINPVVTAKPGTSQAFFFERCASVPGYEAVVGRPLEVSVEAMNEEGRRVSFSAKGWQARQLQHTVDILEGVLYVDRMETRSFRRDTVEEDLPEGVPYGVKSKAKARRHGGSGFARMSRLGMWGFPSTLQPHVYPNPELRSMPKSHALHEWPV
ncbi:Peptide deformylase 1A [Durusdinium trenchii]|uniref:Peptide deformylase n=1 Tax=Durusdinium trenchii TaxID=1381693 RepID=A0ABP0JIC4_9DINO